jgi:adenylate kinase
MRVVFLGAPGVGKGTQADRIAGQLVPDAVVIGLVREKLAEPGSANGFVLDGFPRTVPQAEELGQVLQTSQRPLHRVVKFEVPREDVIRRLSGRRSCPKCQATFHVEFAPSKKGDTCERCGESLIQRSDDKPEAIETRLKVYEEQTAPLIQYYARKRLLSEVNASGSVDTVFEALFSVLAPYSAI